MHTVTETITNAANAVAGDEAAVTALFGSAAINLAIIAEAVSKLQHSNPDPTKPLSLRDLDPTEISAIEKLRTGNFKVVSNHVNPSDRDGDAMS